ncbi:tRNA (guanosine(37)-N1)-methyltransferase TrmD [Natronoflexus pectinivorans]|uniref:tRNA (guanine-N(1)-)-methyltransferase n=1 Tax=Natronoflexus pectinivorans TaxID=682526 RepID=A0A4R2GK99_9BACT|nr:tRNA (guanosine(37)-N1)-methyltransferase TrmD [Natronoflexus pectinivorans]TCO08904.1 tRNA (guanine37-N1)-methyltransferase [Natronoflexus pectinivorans]
MRIDILTLFPEMFEGPFNESILRRAQEKGFVEIVLHDIRDYSQDKHKKVDDYAFGGGAGMVMQIEPIALLLDKLKGERDYEEIIYMTPDGSRFSQAIANQFSLLGNIIILCGHYKGVDQRVRDHYVTREISIGDFVLTGGELAAAVVVDAVVRLIPGVISDETSALTDSFQDNLLAPPVYTRPAEFRGWRVPDVLLSGHQAKIDQWREEQAWKRTKNLRPDLLDEE